MFSLVNVSPLLNKVDFLFLFMSLRTLAKLENMPFVFGGIMVSFILMPISDSLAG